MSVRCRNPSSPADGWMMRGCGGFPERPEPPLDSNMTFTPADFCVGESGIWFFSLTWEYGEDAEPVEFLDDKNIRYYSATPARGVETPR